eukprot:251950-Pelagomonas_calceolata.AAC.1
MGAGLLHICGVSLLLHIRCRKQVPWEDSSEGIVRVNQNCSGPDYRCYPQAVLVMACPGLFWNAFTQHYVGSAQDV